MSITAALNAAQSGLTAASRTAQAVSSNVANALTPGYGAREVALSSAGTGGSPSTGWRGAAISAW